MAAMALGFCLLATATLAIGRASAYPTVEFETVKTSNAAIFNRLGLIRQDPADGHHRKRLAGPDAFGSRGHHQAPYAAGRHSGGGGAAGGGVGPGEAGGGSPRDSHVYIVKLPPSLPYYSFSKPVKSSAGSDLNVTLANPNPGFRNNGRPAKIYHWNLPLLKKMNEKRKQLALAKSEQAKRRTEAERERQKVADRMSYFKKLAQEQLVAGKREDKPARSNDKWLNLPEKIEARTKTSDTATQLKILTSTSTSGGPKVYRLDDDRYPDQMPRSAPSHRRFGDWRGNSGNDLNGPRNALDVAATRPKKHRKKSAVSYYYAPVLAGRSVSNSISKQFAGNGKPKAFYVMEKSRKPAYYHEFLP